MFMQSTSSRTRRYLFMLQMTALRDKQIEKITRKLFTSITLYLKTLTCSVYLISSVLSRCLTQTRTVLKHVAVTPVTFCITLQPRCHGVCSVTRTMLKTGIERYSLGFFSRCGATRRGFPVNFIWAIKDNVKHDELCSNSWTSPSVLWNLLRRHTAGVV